MSMQVSMQPLCLHSRMIYSCNLLSHSWSNCCGGVRNNFSNSAILCDASSSSDFGFFFGRDVFVEDEDMETARMASRRALWSVVLDIVGLQILATGGNGFAQIFQQNARRALILVIDEIQIKLDMFLHLCCMQCPE